MIDTNQLKLALADPALANLSDDQVVALPGFGTPALTPKTALVTYVTLASVWGAMRLAQFKAAMNGAMAQTANPPFAALATAIDTVLQIGIDPANRDVPGVGAEFVAAGLATQDEFNAVFYDATYKAGAAVVAADVTAARAEIAWASGRFDRRRLASAQYNAAIDWLESLSPADPLPSDADVLARLGTAVP